jgi:hypothetical protein
MLTRKVTPIRHMGPRRPRRSWPARRRVSDACRTHPPRGDPPDGGPPGRPRWSGGQAAVPPVDADQRSGLRLVSRRSLLPVPSSPLRAREHQGTIGTRPARFRSPRRSHTLARSPAPPQSGPRGHVTSGRGRGGGTARARARPCRRRTAPHGIPRHDERRTGAAPSLRCPPRLGCPGRRSELAPVSRDSDARLAAIAGNADRPRDAWWGNRKRRDAAKARGPLNP